MKGYGIKSASLRTVLKTMLSADVAVISVSEAAAKIDTALFLDTREIKEYSVSHLLNGIWIGHNDFDLVRLKNISLTQPIIVYCSIGKRSDTIARALLKAGYTTVKNLAGGIFEWVNQGHPVYKEDRQTNNVHVYNKFWGRWLTKGNKVY